MNDAMSFGVHRIWKDVFVNEIGVLRPSRQYSPEGNIERKIKAKVLDVAAGSGDIAFKIIDKQIIHSRSIIDDLEVTCLDINGEMLKQGQKRAQELGLRSNLIRYQYFL